jgi:hypothetical protein
VNVEISSLSDRAGSMPRPEIVLFTPFDCPDPDQGLFQCILRTPYLRYTSSPRWCRHPDFNCRQTLPHLSVGSMMDMDEAGGWLSLIEVNVYLKDPSRTVGNFPV